MTRIALLSALFLSLLLPATQLWAQTFSSLEERMSAADFAAAGLDNLSPEELARLNEWLRNNVGGSSHGAMPSAQDRIGFATPQPSGRVVSQIDGNFKGWSGDTVFRLTNGQVWQQVDSGSRLAVDLESPTVRIQPGLFGSWEMRVEGYNTRVKVKRLQ